MSIVQAAQQHRRVFAIINFMLVLVLTLSSLRTSRPAQAAIAQPQPRSTWGVDGLVTASTIAGTTLYVAGEFAAAAPAVGRFALASTTTGAPQSGTPLVSGLVTATIPDGSGGWYIGGSFITINGLIHTRLAHILANNTLDPWSSALPNGIVSTMLITGTTLYIGGTFTSVDGQSRSRLAAFDTTSKTLLAWNPTTNGPVQSLAIAGSVVYVGGGFTMLGGQPRSRLGSVDVQTGALSTWDPNMSSTVTALTISGTTLYAGGSFTAVGSPPTTRNRLAAFDVTTGLLTSWDPNASNTVQTIAITGTTVYAGGSFTMVGPGLTTTRNRGAAFATTTGAVLSWNPDFNGTVSALKTSGSTVYAGGSFTQVSGTSRAFLAAINGTTGSPQGVVPTPSNSVAAIAVAGQTVAFGGNFTATNSQPRTNIAALDLTTGAATGLNVPLGSVYIPAALSLAADATNLYVGGTFTSTAGLTRTYLAAIDRAAGTVTSWSSRPQRRCLHAACERHNALCWRRLYNCGRPKP